MGRSFHQPGTVNENVLESDFESICDGTMRRRSLADLRLLEGINVDERGKVVHLERPFHQGIIQESEI